MSSCVRACVRTCVRADERRYATVFFLDSLHIREGIENVPFIFEISPLLRFDLTGLWFISRRS